jgi:hypothetical protein
MHESLKSTDEARRLIFLQKFNYFRRFSMNIIDIEDTDFNI